MADPDTLSDKGLRTAQMIRSGEGQAAAIERGPGIWESRGVGNSYLVVTPDGDVIINAGTLSDARRSKELFAAVSSNPVAKIILTQSHANQYGGLEIFKTPDNTVMTHRFYPAERSYNEMLSAHYRRGSRRFFGTITGRTDEMVPTREVVPDVLIGDEGHAFTLGNRRFEIIWTPGGETRSAVIVWLPDDRVAMVGNLFGPLFGNHPNLNTVRGDKPRSAAEFIASVQKLRALKPVQILTGHEDIRGEEHIQQETTRIIDSVQWVHDQVVAGMNEGTDLRTLMREVQTPDDLRLTEEYGKVAWNVRAIWHEYTGWFDPSSGTTGLYGVPPSTVAHDLVELAGGAGPMARRAQEYVQQGKPLEALHILEVASAAAPQDDSVRAAKRDALMLLDQQTGGKNLWERMWISTELKQLAE